MEGDKPVGLCLVGKVLVSLGANHGPRGAASLLLCIMHGSEERALCQHVHDWVHLQHLLAFSSHPSMGRARRTHLLHHGRD